MKSCSSCGHECANAAGYCCKCLAGFSGKESMTLDSTDERIGPYLLSGLVLFLSLSVVTVAWLMISKSGFWDVTAQVLRRSFQ